MMWLFLMPFCWHLRENLLLYLKGIYQSHSEDYAVWKKIYAQSALICEAYEWAKLDVISSLMYESFG